MSIGLAIAPDRFNSNKNSVMDGIDPVLVSIVVALLALGLVMVASASITVADRQLHSPFYYLQRQAIAAGLGMLIILFMLKVRLVYWEKSGLILLGLAFFLLLLVFMPGIGKTVNGSTRWIPLGVFNLQVSELVKLLLMIYVAGYLVRHGEEVRSSLWGFLKPMIMVGLACLLLLMEPDFGASVVVMATVMGMMFLGGVKLLQFAAIITLFSGAAAILVLSSSYRLQRLTTFINPWADPFDSGFQLTQSLIAIGSGGWTGSGLGSSVQKLFYLPEAHTDFVFAVMAEELGLFGVAVVISLFGALVLRSFMIARRAELNGNQFSAFLAYGIGIWLGLQAFINIGVNMGVLPTKGLTLPFMSYGGSSLIVCCAAVGLLLRIHYECNSSQAVTRKRSSVKPGKSSRRKPGTLRETFEEAA